MTSDYHYEAELWSPAWARMELARFPRLSGNCHIKWTLEFQVGGVGVSGGWNR